MTEDVSWRQRLAVAALRLGGGRLQQRRHLLVRAERGGRQMPGAPVRPVVQGVGQLAVRRRALRERRRVVVSRSVEGSGSAAHRRLAAGSSATTLASSISAIGWPAAWASTCARTRQ
jgi:hypothetical protein